MLAFSATFEKPVTMADASCIDTCMERLAACENGSGGTVNCEEAYNSCVDRCLLHD
jgi:hypothetical protein